MKNRFEFLHLAEDILPMLFEWLNRSHLINQFISDEENLGKGIGTVMISEFVELLFKDKSITEIRVDPGPDNLRAIRSYEKVGFHKIKNTSTP